MKRRRVGKIVIPAGVHVWRHEMATAMVLAEAGHEVEFIRKSPQDGVANADVRIDGEDWEMKAPNGGSLRLVENNLRRAVAQADSVVFDSRRVKGIPDKAILRELTTQLRYIRRLRRIKFVNRHCVIVDIV